MAQEVKKAWKKHLGSFLTSRSLDLNQLVIQNIQSFSCITIHMRYLHAMFGVYSTDPGQLIACGVQQIQIFLQKSKTILVTTSMMQYYFVFVKRGKVFPLGNTQSNQVWNLLNKGYQIHSLSKKPHYSIFCFTAYVYIYMTHMSYYMYYTYIICYTYIYIYRVGQKNAPKF